MFSKTCFNFRSLLFSIHISSKVERLWNWTIILFLDWYFNTEPSLEYRRSASSGKMCLLEYEGEYIYLPGLLTQELLSSGRPISFGNTRVISTSNEHPRYVHFNWNKFVQRQRLANSCIGMCVNIAHLYISGDAPACRNLVTVQGNSEVTSSTDTHMLYCLLQSLSRSIHSFLLLRCFVRIVSNTRFSPFRFYNISLIPLRRTALCIGCYYFRR